MKKSKSPLHISIPEPCHENWNDMPADEMGRYCIQCSRIIVDFSGMTDTELIQFFKKRPTGTCGRFRTSQLDRDITPQQPQRLLATFYKKAVAAVITLLSFRFSNAQVQKPAPVAASTQSAVSRSNSLPDSITLTGKVTQNYSQPVANARVSFEGLIETYTDTEGRFRLQLSTEMLRAHLLYFSAAGLKRAVRNFNPAMGTTEYNVNLDSPDECVYSFHTMGVPMMNAVLHDFPSIAFAKSETTLSPDEKLLLATLAEHMKMEPQMVVKLVAYGKGITGTKRAANKNKLITNYMVKEMGISGTRIKQQIENISGIKLVDILQEQE